MTYTEQEYLRCVPNYGNYMTYPTIGFFPMRTHEGEAEISGGTIGQPWHDFGVDNIAKWTIHNPLPVYVYPVFYNKNIKNMMVAFPTKNKIIPNVFQISFDDFKKLEYDEISILQNEVKQIMIDDLEQSWKEGFREVIVCNGQIVGRTEEESMSDNEIERLGKEYQKACYVFCAPDVSEESPWQHLGDNDHYPTFPVYIGESQKTDSEIIDQSSPINADFDTGNPQYRIFDADRLDSPLSDFTGTLRTTAHIRADDTYDFFNKDVRICIKDETGVISSILESIRVVKNWESTPLIKYNKNREGFVGRDLMIKFNVKIELDPQTKSTKLFLN